MGKFTPTNNIIKILNHEVNRTVDMQVAAEAFENKMLTADQQHYRTNANEQCTQVTGKQKKQISSKTQGFPGRVPGVNP